MIGKIVLTALALVPLFLIFVYPHTAPGDTTIQQRAELIRMPVSILASLMLLLLVVLPHWQPVGTRVGVSSKHRLLDLTCTRLC